MASATFDWPRAKLVLLTSCRILLVPLLMLCAAPRDRPLIAGEFWPFFFSILLGISNGYFGSVPMILAPGRVPDEQRELTGLFLIL
jgi:solute carrier family 29 (equilibrative nucleoside transporter) protein 4